MSNKAEIPDKSKTSDKLLAGVIVLSCLIPGRKVKDIFDAIRNRRLDLFKDIDSSRLKLYKNKEYAESVIIDLLMKDNVAILDGTEWMDPEKAIYNYFNGRPKLSFQGEKGVNVVVYPPTETVPEVLSKDNTSDTGL
ncbi:hypothetical protein C1646_736727 [Rhizophagus diaphanus]|nr:hypothetical protein C1646_736727 [Rhizophagus diaphanus] [Rhizophagus sp. MUCL 43196]